MKKLKKYKLGMIHYFIIRIAITCVCKIWYHVYKFIKYGFDYDWT